MTHTRLFGSLVAGLAAAAVLICSGPVGGQERKKQGPHVVAKIIDVKYHFEEINPPNLVVKAYGEVPTGGYDPKLVQLTRVTYITPPADGIQDYILTATPPGGIVPQVISTVEGKDTWKGVAPWVKGARVHGVGEGIKVVMFGEKK